MNKYHLRDALCVINKDKEETKDTDSIDYDSHNNNNVESSGNLNNVEQTKMIKSQQYRQNDVDYNISGNDKDNKVVDIAETRQ